MFYEYQDQKRAFIFAEKEILFVPEFQALQSAYGWNAVQYLFYFVGSRSPYSGLKNKAERDEKCLQAMAGCEWKEADPVPARLYEDTLFLRAESAFQKEDRDRLADELIQISNERDQIALVRSKIDWSVAPDASKLEDYLKILKLLDEREKQIRHSYALQLDADHSPAVTMHDI